MVAEPPAGRCACTARSARTARPCPPSPSVEPRCVVQLHEPLHGVAPGQAVVLYDGDPGRRVRHDRPHRGSNVHWADGSATGVGSLPGTDVREAVRLVLGELPGPSAPAGAARPRPRRRPHRPRHRPPGRPARRGAAVRLAPRRRPPAATSGAPSPSWGRTSTPSRSSPRGTGPLKLQVAGPWTLASTLELPHGDNALADPGACRDLAESLAEGLRRTSPTSAAGCPAPASSSSSTSRRCPASCRDGPDRQRLRPAAQRRGGGRRELLAKCSAAARGRPPPCTAAPPTSRSSCSAGPARSTLSFDLAAAMTARTASATTSSARRSRPARGCCSASSCRRTEEAGGRTRPLPSSPCGAVAAARPASRGPAGSSSRRPAGWPGPRRSAARTALGRPGRGPRRSSTTPRARCDDGEVEIQRPTDAGSGSARLSRAARRAPATATTCSTRRRSATASTTR